MPSVNGYSFSPFIKKMILKAAQRYNLNPSLLAGQEQIESGFNPGPVSSAGAFGISQFIPSTAASYGVKPGSSRSALKSQIMGQAHLLADLGAVRGNRQSIIEALGGYYGASGTGYEQKVLDAAKAYKFLNKLGPGAAGPAGPAGPSGTPPGITPPAVFQPGGGGAAGSPYDDPTVRAYETILNLGERTKNSPEVNQGWAALADLALKHASTMAAAGGGLKAPKSQFTLGMPKGAAAAAAAGGGKGGGGGGPANLDLAVLSDGADRAGVNTKKTVLRFVAQIAAAYGHPLTIGTGTNHSQYTTSGNVSDHWSGHAADIPATGKTLLRLGRLALIAAGMPKEQAHQATGGLYNVNGHQIIFLTYEGGDHYNHLHVSAY